MRGIALKDDKLLCVLLRPYSEHVSTMNGAWCLPGGGLDEGEAVLDGIRREMIEETGIDPVVGNLLYVQQFSNGKMDFLEFFFHITNADDYLNIDLSKSTHGLEEIEKIGFIDPATTPLLPEFLMSENLTAQAASGITKFFAR